MKQIPLSQEQFALVDDEDYEFLMQWKWYAFKSKKTFYAVRSQYVGVKNPKRFWMHRVLLDIKDKNLFCDHKDRNGLNNQRHNLRVCTSAENAKNQSINSKNKTGIRGVCVEQGKFRVTICGNGFRINVGSFLSSNDAALAYDLAATKLFGQYAQPNLPQQTAPEWIKELVENAFSDNRKNQRNSSGFIGVHFCKKTKMFAADIVVNKIRHRLGRFKNPIDAAKSYDTAAKNLRGENAKLNFPDK